MSETAQEQVCKEVISQVKAPTTQPDDLSSIPGTCTVLGESQLIKIVL